MIPVKDIDELVLQHALKSTCEFPENKNSFIGNK